MRSAVVAGIAQARSLSLRQALCTPSRSIVLDPSAFQRPQKPLSREEKLRQAGPAPAPASSVSETVTVSSGEAGVPRDITRHADEDDSSFFEFLTPLSSSRSAPHGSLPPSFPAVVPLPSEASNTPSPSAARRAARRAREHALASSARPAGVQVSTSLAAAVARGELPSLVGGAEGRQVRGKGKSFVGTREPERDPYSMSDIEGEDVDEYGMATTIHGSAHGAPAPPARTSKCGTSSASPSLASTRGLPSAGDAGEGGDETLNWFPGHMAKAVQAMAQRLKDVQIVVEVRDARCPTSSANPLLDRVAAGKPRVVVLNKADLAAPRAGFGVGQGGSTAALLAKAADALSAQLGPAPPPAHWQALVQAAEAAEAAGETGAVAALQFLPGKEALSAADAKKYDEAVEKDEGGRRRGSFGRRDVSWGRRSGKATTNPAASAAAADAVASESASGLATHSSGSGGRAWCPHIILPGGRGAVVLTDARSSAAAPHTLLALVQRLAPPRRFRAVPTAVLVCGYPNVGKSTLINALRRAALVAGALADGYGLAGLGDAYVPVSGGGKAKVGPLPGVTKHVQGFRVSEDPPVVVLDTPGVMAPQSAAALAGPAAAARLGLVGSVPEAAVSVDALTLELLTVLNARPHKEYVRALRLQAPTRDPLALWAGISRAQGWTDGNIRGWQDSLALSFWGRALHPDEAKRRLLKERVIRAHEVVEQALRAGTMPPPQSAPQRELQGERVPAKGKGKISPGIAAGPLAWAASLPRVSERSRAVNWARVDPLQLPETREEVLWEMSPDLIKRAQALFLKKYREGALGRFSLD